MTNSPDGKECQESDASKAKGLAERASWMMLGPRTLREPVTHPATPAQATPVLPSSFSMGLLSIGSPAEIGDCVHFPKNIYYYML